MPSIPATPNLPDLPHHQSSIHTLNTTTPNFRQIYWQMPSILLHQTCQMYPPLKHRCLQYCYTKLSRCTGRSTLPQSSIHAFNTTTPNLPDLPPNIKHRCSEYCYTKHWQMYWYPPPIKHRCLQYHATPNLADLLANLPPIQHTYPEYLHQTWQIYWQMPSILLHQTWQMYPHQSSIDAIQYCYTKLGRSTGRSTPQIKHRCLQYCYTKLCRSGRSTTTKSSIHALNTTTPNLADLLADAFNTATPNLTDQPPIKHRCLQYCYTKLGRCTGRSTSQSSIDAFNTCYTKLARWQTPHQSSIHAFLNTTTPNLADLQANLPPPFKHRCLQYCYTKLGRCTPHQSSIDAFNTATPNLTHTGRSSLPIKHGCLQNHYTKLARSTPPPIKHTCLEYHYTKLADLLANLPPPFKHRCLQYCYTKLSQIYPTTNQA